MNLWEKIKSAVLPERLPVHLQHGVLGEKAARKHLQQLGLKFLTANFRSKRGEIDLVFRDQDCLQFVPLWVNPTNAWARVAYWL